MGTGPECRFTPSPFTLHPLPFTASLPALTPYRLFPILGPPARSYLERTSHGIARAQHGFPVRRVPRLDREQQRPRAAAVDARRRGGRPHPELAARRGPHPD